MDEHTMSFLSACGILSFRRRIVFRSPQVSRHRSKEWISSSVASDGSTAGPVLLIPAKFCQCCSNVKMSP